jgi:hypothetical protein
MGWSFGSSKREYIPVSSRLFSPFFDLTPQKNPEICMWLPDFDSNPRASKATRAINMIFSTTPLVWLALISAAVAQTPVTCGVKGYDKQTPKAYVVNSTITTLPACRNLCATSTVTKCVAFALEAAPSPACLLYNGTGLTGNFLSMNTSTYTFYELSCPT